MKTGASLGELPGLTAATAHYSPEGHWVVSAGRALHVPSGLSLEYDPLAANAVFTPEGDIVAGELDGALVQFCRRTAQE